MYLKFLAAHIETDTVLQEYLIKFNVELLSGIAGSVDHVLRQEQKNQQDIVQ